MPIDLKSIVVHLVCLPKGKGQFGNHPAIIAYQVHVAVFVGFEDALQNGAIKGAELYCEYTAQALCCAECSLVGMTSETSAIDTHLKAK